MTISITVSRATQQDAERVSACLSSAFEPYRSQYTPAAFEDTVPTPERVQARMRHMAIYVARTTGGDFIGTIASSIEGKEGHLRGMAVVPAWQGRSVADCLLRAAEQDLAAASCERVTLDTTAPLERAIRFYERNGFVPTGRVTDFFGMPLYEYAKTLSPCDGRVSPRK
jgi:ribosomal protein S18 acetylase RimI-like enzyme